MSEELSSREALEKLDRLIEAVQKMSDRPKLTVSNDRSLVWNDIMKANNATPPEPTLEQKMQERCVFWQQKLRLTDWDIKVSIAPALEMTYPNAQGQVRWFADEKAANIKLVDPADSARQSYIRPYNIEEVLIHELIHLHLHHWEPEETAEKSAQEFAINAIAAALLKLNSPT